MDDSVVLTIVGPGQALALCLGKDELSVFIAQFAQFALVFNAASHDAGIR